MWPFCNLHIHKCTDRFTVERVVCDLRARISSQGWNKGVLMVSVQPSQQNQTTWQVAANKTHVACELTVILGAVGNTNMSVYVSEERDTTGSLSEISVTKL